MITKPYHQIVSVVSITIEPANPPFPDIETLPLAPSGYRAWWRAAPGCYAEAPTKDEAIERLRAQRAEQEAE